MQLCPTHSRRRGQDLLQLLMHLGGTRLFIKLSVSMAVLCMHILEFKSPVQSSLFAFFLERLDHMESQTIALSGGTSKNGHVTCLLDIRPLEDTRHCR